MQQSMPRILFISGADANWLWLSDAVGDRFMLVRESGTFSEITKRVGLVSPSMAVVDYSPQVGLDASLIVKELRELALTELREYRVEGGELRAIAEATVDAIVDGQVVPGSAHPEHANHNTRSCRHSLFTIHSLFAHYLRL